MAPISLTDHSSTPNLQQSNQTSVFGSVRSPSNGAQVQWDPNKVLNIHPNNPDFSCMGIARYSNARCRWQLRDLSIRRAACKHLDSIASMRPHEVTRASLKLLAGEVLCYNHTNQMYDIVSDLQRRIDDYSGRSSERPPATTTLEPQSQQAISVSLEQKLENVRLELERLTTERDASQTDSVKWKAEVEKLRSQQIQSLERSERVEKRLKGKLTESELTAKIARDDSKAKLEEITALIKQLTQSQKSETAKMDEIQRLKQDLATKDIASQEQASSHATQLADLQKTLSDRNVQISTLENAQTKSNINHSSELQHLRQSFADQIAMSRDLSSSHATTVSDLNARLADHTTTIQNLGSANQNLREARSEQKRRIAKLETQGQKVRRQGYVAEWRHAVKMLVERRKNEQVMRERAGLEEQVIALKDQLEASEKKMGVQEVSSPIYACCGAGIVKIAVADGICVKRILSSLRLDSFKKGVCAVVTTHPLRVSMKRCSKMGPLVA